MLRQILEWCMTVAMIVALGVGVWGLDVYPVSRSMATSAARRKRCCRVLADPERTVIIRIGAPSQDRFVRPATPEQSHTRRRR